MTSIALIEPLSVAWHAVQVSSFKPEDFVLILGGGPIGLGILQVLKARKAKHVIVSELTPGRKEFAAQFGADLVLDPREGDMASKCRDYCDGRGPDIVFDAAGVQQGLDLAVRVSRVGATIVNIAAWEKPATINPMEMIVGEKKYVATMTYVRKDFEEVLEAVASGKCDSFALEYMFLCRDLCEIPRKEGAANAWNIQSRVAAAGQHDYGPNRP